MAREYKERDYRREHFLHGRVSFVVEYKKSDLWIAVDRSSYDAGMQKACGKILKRLWEDMEEYMAQDPGYSDALTPYPAAHHAPKILQEMSLASAQAGTGPMSAVAGAVSKHLASELKKRYPYIEIIVENGGDIYAEFVEDITVVIFAGESPLSGKVGLSVPAGYSPLGICTSSGTVGPSLSLGKADAVMIACRDVVLADAYATAFGNEVKSIHDVDTVIESIGAREEILAGVIVKNDKIGIVGEFDLEIIG